MRLRASAGGEKESERQVSPTCGPGLGEGWRGSTTGGRRGARWTQASAEATVELKRGQHRHGES